MSDAPAPQDNYNEVTLADLADALIRRRALFAVVFVGILVASTVVTYTTPEEYEASASYILINERDEAYARMSGDAFRMDALENADGLVDLRVSLGPPELPASQRKEVTFTVVAGSPEQVDAGLTVVADALVALRSDLQQITWNKNWESYFEGAWNNATAAEAELQALVDGMHYTQSAGEATGPAQTAPDLNLNLALGTVLGLMMAFFAVFAWEAAVKVKAELQEKRASRKS